MYRLTRSSQDNIWEFAGTDIVIGDKTEEKDRDTGDDTREKKSISQKYITKMNLLTSDEREEECGSERYEYDLYDKSYYNKHSKIRLKNKHKYYRYKPYVESYSSSSHRSSSSLGVNVCFSFIFSTNSASLSLFL